MIKNDYRKQLKGAAFTLIELLVVIAIIAILASILIPLISGGLERARATKSLSNLRQIGSAINLYVISHDGDFPYLNASAERTNTNLYWPLSIENDLFDAPRSYAHEFEKHPVLRDPLLSDDQTHVISDYGGNSWIFRNAWGTQPYGESNSKPFNNINVRRPESTIVVCTAGANGRGSWWIDYSYPRGSNSNAMPDSRLPGDKVGAVFVDGHIESIPAERLLNDLDFRRASFDPLYEP
ncbi:prepilin-type N-terminal cleavage/methylation domain-containing protein [Coraliomargarita sp. W4R53]